MSEKKIKTVRVKESDLVNLLENIVNDTVKSEKKKFIAEQAKKTEEKTELLESRIAKLEKMITSSKKG
jgi:methionyl-tRNA synthetase